MKKIYLIILFGVFCLNLNAQEIDVSDFEIVEYEILPIVNDNELKIDTVFIYKSDTIHLIIENECLRDSLLNYVRYDTNSLLKAKR